jgi:hypothetical protein
MTPLKVRQGLQLCLNSRNQSEKPTRSVEVNLARLFKAGGGGVTTLVRRVATIEKSVFWTSFSSLTRRKCLDDLIPALKGRAKFMTTLRVALSSSTSCL